MNYEFHFGPWDLALLLAVTAHATSIAYLHQPRWKALLLSLPVPFTLSSLALGKPIDATHVGGAILFLGYIHGVRVLHYTWQVPIIAAIVFSALAYAFIGALLAQILPASNLAFWITACLALALGIILLFSPAHRPEPNYRSPLSVWVKTPVVSSVILSLIVLKQLLSGFMTFFPMVGVVAAYESRYSLGTICRQMPAFLLPSVLLMITARLTQTQWAVGLGPALLIGWGVFLATFVPLTWAMSFSNNRSPSTSA